ncbi:CDP-alcohol phosphatidyltransferase family protein [Limoniibacter endophyticus]|uniref:CDP-diacylglycerol--glycerol-3-phosphate 3-phosphatidyltransferase n=1 Tax=Limoniibacter endophyticus TaxID=1565040 RepID=A0A8J3DGA6_9HYPH|nr:CDP-alcohol phosphatidyltransferase family protein [Limoniibacter endophyticus]GHC68658.1 CDP-alcohol phosphatidyltransferase [Limoniibacter endophyticus]
MTIPNLITLFRLALVPVVVVALLQGRFDLAFVGFVVAGLSDAIDGYIARRFDMRSELGAYLDPIADKLLMTSVFVILGMVEALPVWLVVLVVSRDVAIIAAVMLSFVMGMPVTMRPLKISKLNTGVQIALAAITLGQMAFLGATGALHNYLVYICATLTAFSAVAYLVIWLRHMSGNDNRA